MPALPAGDPRAWSLSGRREIHAVIRIDVRDRLGVAAGCPHRVICPAHRDMLAVSFRAENAGCLVRLANVGLVNLAVDPDPAVLIDRTPENRPRRGETPVHAVVALPRCR